MIFWTLLDLLDQCERVGSAAETTAAARAGHRSTLPLGAERDSLLDTIPDFLYELGMKSSMKSFWEKFIPTN